MLKDDGWIFHWVMPKDEGLGRRSLSSFLQLGRARAVGGDEPSHRGGGFDDNRPTEVAVAVYDGYSIVRGGGGGQVSDRG